MSAADPLPAGPASAARNRRPRVAIVWTGRFAVDGGSQKDGIAGPVYLSGGHNAIRSSPARGMADYRGHCRRAAWLLQLIAYQLRQGEHGFRDDHRGPAQLCGREPQGVVRAAPAQPVVRTKAQAHGRRGAALRPGPPCRWDRRLAHHRAIAARPWISGGNESASGWSEPPWGGREKS